MKKGFTILELLIVISIISILVSFGSSIYFSAQRSSRDAKRKADLEQIRSALEMYRSENNQYPVSLSINDSCSTGDFFTYLVPIPEDPRCQIYRYSYAPFDSGGDTCADTETCVDYTLGTYLEGVGSTCTVTTYDCRAASGTTSCNYCLGPYGKK